MGCCRSKGAGKGGGPEADDVPVDKAKEESEDEEYDNRSCCWLPREYGLPVNPSQLVGYENSDYPGPISPKSGRRIKRTYSSDFQGDM